MVAGLKPFNSDGRFLMLVGNELGSAEQEDGPVGLLVTTPKGHVRRVCEHSTGDARCNSAFSAGCVKDSYLTTYLTGATDCSSWWQSSSQTMHVHGLCTDCTVYLITLGFHSAGYMYTCKAHACVLQVPSHYTAGPLQRGSLNSCWAKLS
jgi:hypothetical protein